MTNEAMHYHTLDNCFNHLTTHHVTKQYVNGTAGATINLTSLPLTNKGIM